jgi:hypothetical protein
MSQIGVQLFIPMEALIESLKSLGLSEKRQIWQILDEEIAQAEEENWEDNEATAIEIQAVREEYVKGEYTTFNEYLSQQSK